MYVSTLIYAVKYCILPPQLLISSSCIHSSQVPEIIEKTTEKNSLPHESGLTGFVMFER